jgi:hypothetical protein
LENQRWRQCAKRNGCKCGRAQAAQTSLTIQENGLRDRRGAGRAMRCNKIFRVEKLERRVVARNLMRHRDQIMRRKCESRRVEHLADVASRLGSLGVVVQKRDARHNVEQHHAAKNCERLVRELLREEPCW